jgi:hypothetical protein
MHARCAANFAKRLPMLNLKEFNLTFFSLRSSRRDGAVFTPCIAAASLVKGGAETVANASAGKMAWLHPLVRASEGLKAWLFLLPDLLPDSKINRWWCVRRPPQHKGEMAESVSSAVEITEIPMSDSASRFFEGKPRGKRINRTSPKTQSAPKNE